MRVTRFVNLTCVFLVAALVGTNVYAGGRPDSSSRDWFGHINGGYTFATGTTSDFLDDDWTLGGGAMYWPSDWPLGIALDVNYCLNGFAGQIHLPIVDIERYTYGP